MRDVTETRFPRCAWVNQEIAASTLQGVQAEIRKELARIGLGSMVRQGSRIAVTAGSRGIHDMVKVLRAVVARLRDLGALPSLVPAMGSHGGASAEGQEGVLARLGITESAVGAPIRSSMEVVQLGTTPSGIPVHVDKLAA